MLDIALFKSGKERLSLYLDYSGSVLKIGDKGCFIYLFAKSQTKLKMPSFPNVGCISAFACEKCQFLNRNIFIQYLKGAGALRTLWRAGGKSAKKALWQSYNSLLDMNAKHSLTI